MGGHKLMRKIAFYMSLAACVLLIDLAVKKGHGVFSLLILKNLRFI